MLFHYLSYKIARLALPWILILIAIDSFLLPRPWNFGGGWRHRPSFICARRSTDGYRRGAC